MGMAEFDVLDKVRRAREQAASTATGLRDAVSERVGDARDLLASGAADLRDASVAKMRETLEEFNATLPALREAGYSLTGVSVTVGVPPKIVASFGTSDAVTEESTARVIEENKDHKLVVFLVRTLYEAWKLQMSVHLVGMKPRGIAVEIGLTPRVTVNFA
jgi:hypothetical protein